MSQPPAAPPRPPPPPPPPSARPVSHAAPPPPPPPPRRASTATSSPVPPPPATALNAPVSHSPALESSASTTTSSLPSSPPPLPSRPLSAVPSAPPPPTPPSSVATSVLPPPPARPATPPPVELTEAPSSPTHHTSSNANTNNTATSSSVVSNEGDAVVLEGILSKRNREGNFEKCFIVVTAKTLRYGKVAGTSAVASFSDKLTSAVSRAANVATAGSVGAPGTVASTASAASAAATTTTAASGENKLSESATEIPLETILVQDLVAGDYDDVSKMGRAFRFLSKHKSFLLRAKSEEEAHLWMETLLRLSSELRRTMRLTEPTLNDCAPLWAHNATANNCSLCRTNFTLFVRRHHCRNCGALVCEPCSRERMRIPRLDEKQLFRVCNPCGVQLKDNRSYGASNNNINNNNNNSNNWATSDL